MPAKVAANRAELEQHLDGCATALRDGPRTAFELIGDIVGPENVTPATAAWGLQLALAYLDHLVALGELERIDGADPHRWQLSDG